MAKAKKAEVMFETPDVTEAEKAAMDVALAEGKKRDQAHGFRIPTDFVKLPSRGLIYPQDSSLYLAEEVEVKQMTASEEDILTSRSLIRNGKAVDMVVSSCLVDKTIVVDDLLTGDKNAILMALRVNAYGTDYKLDVTCPTCSEETKAHPFDLNSLEMKTLDIKPLEEGTNRFSYITESGIELEFRFFTNGLVKQVTEEQSQIKRVSGQAVDKNVTASLKTYIISIGGNKNKADIYRYVEIMPARDSRTLRRFIDENEPDLTMKQEFDCPHCGNTNEVDVPISAEFFWPSS